MHDEIIVNISVTLGNSGLSGIHIGPIDIVGTMLAKRIFSGVVVVVNVTVGSLVTLAPKDLLFLDAFSFCAVSYCSVSSIISYFISM